MHLWQVGKCTRRLVTLPEDISSWNTNVSAQELNYGMTEKHNNKDISQLLFPNYRNAKDNVMDESYTSFAAELHPSIVTQ